ncbi:MAG: Na+/H+ antiporter NhaA [Bacteroidota bacterium]|jgi:NhaA family Na+:H+ antiporter
MKKLAGKLHFKNYIPGRIFNRFIKHQQASGILLIIASAASLLLASSPWGKTYTAFFEKVVLVSGNSHAITPEFLLNDCLMSLFFFLVSIEIKRELVSGELSSPAKAALPLVAAWGGMVVPALLYLACNVGSGYARGWGIPTATDIAFSLAVLSLAMKNVPGIFRIFLTSLAVADDLGAVAVIAIFYHGEMHPVFLLFTFLLVILTFFLQKKIQLPSIYYLILVVFCWYLLEEAGVHPTLSGVIAGFVMPGVFGKRMEKWLEKPVHFVVVPLFAMANTAVPLFPNQLSNYPGISLGILAGLCLGKPLGIFLAAYLGKKFRIITWPDGFLSSHLLMLGSLAGIGFTMSVFVSHLAFEDNNETAVARISIVLASLASALIGYFFLRKFANNRHESPL